MTGRSFAASALAFAALAVPAAAPAYPPITCGRTTLSGKTFIVRSHGPTCGFATRSVRAFALHHRSPSGYACHAYGADVPADCINKKRKKQYFLATKQ